MLLVQHRPIASRSSSLAAILFVCMITPVFAKDSKSSEAKETDSSKPAVSELYDADFAKHVDLRSLGIAWQTLDSQLMADVGLQMREAERVLGRKHKVITSDDILAFAGKVAAGSDDVATLARLADVAKADGNSDRASQLKQFQSLASNSRDLRDEAMFSARDVNRGALAAFANLVLQIRAATVAGNKAALEHLRKGVDILSSLRDQQREKLVGRIDEAIASIGKSDATAAAIEKLTGPSRDFASAYALRTGVPTWPLPIWPDPKWPTLWSPPAWPAPAWPVPTLPPTPIAPPPVVVVPPAVPVASASEISYSCSGMRYAMTAGGAVVQSAGRLGSITFKPGDIIVAIGGLPVATGSTVDGLINAGYLSSNRSVRITDSVTGLGYNYFY